jgi:hypothetical protein
VFLPELELHPLELWECQFWLRGPVMAPECASRRILAPEEAISGTKGPILSPERLILGYKEAIPGYQQGNEDRSLFEIYQSRSTTIVFDPVQVLSGARIGIPQT